MTTRSRHDSRGPGRGGRHRARTPVPHPRTHPPDPPRPPVRERAALLLPAPAPTLAGARRGLRLVRRTSAPPPQAATPTVPPDAPLPRPVAIAAARAAVLRSRTAVPHTAVTAAAWQRGSPAPDRADDPVVQDTPAPAPSAAGRLRSAVLERLPVWVQLRCAVEPKTLAALAVVLLVAVGFAVHHFASGRPEAVRAPEVAAAVAPAGAPTSASSAAASAAPGAGSLVVDIAGDVRDPGVHRLPKGSRVADALEAAGGVRPGTGEEELDGLNQARRLVDGEQIVVGGGAAAAVAPAPAAGAPPTGSGPASATRISLSSATAEQLETLPGVGPVLAQHIIDYRTEHAGFTSVAQLRDVDGIGDARFADIQPMVGP